MKHAGSPARVYFSIEPTQGGMADQLQELGVLYSLGRSLGFKYVHRPLRTARSTRPHGLAARVLRRLLWPVRALAGLFAPELFFDVYQFLGINASLRAAHPAPPRSRPKRVEVLLSDGELQGHGVATFEDLRSYVAQFVEQSRHHDDSELLVAFSTRRDVEWFRLVLERKSDSSARLDLRSMYEQARRQQPRRSLFDAHALPVLVHVRQGDTALIETPWGTLVSVWGRVSNWMTEVATIEELDTDRIIREADYAALLRRVHEELGAEPVSSLVFSDGYDRAFRILRDGFRRGRLPWSKEQVDAIEKRAASYERDQFRCLESLDGCSCIVGEGREELCDLIESLMRCRIVVTGTHGDMISKLVATYFEPETMPIVVILYRGQVPDYGTIDLRGMERRFVYVDVEHPDHGRAVARLRELLKG